MGSIENSSINTFELAAKCISSKWQNELFSECRKIKFCATNLDKTLIVILNGDWGRTKYSESLRKALETLDVWATTHASQDQKIFWADISKPHVQTCFEISSMGNHEIIEVVIELEKIAPKLAQSLGIP